MNAPPEAIEFCRNLEREILALIERRVRGLPDAEEIGLTAANGVVIALWIRLVQGAGCPSHKLADEVIGAIRATPWERAVAADVRDLLRKANA